MDPEATSNQELHQLNDMFTNRPNTYYNDFSFKEATHNTAIIFFFANWSGPARAAKVALLQSLIDFPDLQLYMLDNDQSATFSYMIENELLSHGWGETYWLKNGQIISSVNRYESLKMNDLINKHRML